MKLLTFRAETMREALEQVKTLLGPEAVVVESREVGPRRVEVLAGVDTDPKMATRKEPSGAVQRLESDLAEARRRIEQLEAERAVLEKRRRSLERALREGNGGDVLVARLVAGGVAPSVAARLVSGASTHGASDEENAVAVTRALALAFEPAAPVWQRKGRSIAALVGPTGVGKTTTLAKLAAEAALQHGRKVAVVAADTGRIGAVEQVRTYADLIGVPCLPARNAKELRDALSKLSGSELILVDTPGASPWADDTRANLDRLFEGLPVERHVCVHAGTASQELAEFGDRYGRPSSFVVTKMDEARTVGGLVGLVTDGAARIAHVTTGTRVPDDLQRPRPAALVQAVLA